jgi:FKBP-type peptidyl-prolyl cis-trans isomerase
MFRLLISLVLAVAVATELEIIKTHVPDSCDVKSKNGDQLFMHYTGSIDESSETGKKGAVFDSSLTRGTPFDFPLGGGRVIQGWDKGLVDMCVGEKRTLIIPPNMGYGERGAGGAIPGSFKSPPLNERELPPKHRSIVHESYKCMCVKVLDIR